MGFTYRDRSLAPKERKPIPFLVFDGPVTCPPMNGSLASSWIVVVDPPSNLPPTEHNNVYRLQDFRFLIEREVGETSSVIEEFNLNLGPVTFYAPPMPKTWLLLKESSVPSLVDGV